MGLDRWNFSLPSVVLSNSALSGRAPASTVTDAGPINGLTCSRSSTALAMGGSRGCEDWSRRRGFSCPRHQPGTHACYHTRLACSRPSVGEFFHIPPSTSGGRSAQPSAVSRPGCNSPSVGGVGLAREPLNGPKMDKEDGGRGGARKHIALLRRHSARQSKLAGIGSRWRRAGAERLLLARILACHATARRPRFGRRWASGERPKLTFIGW